MKKCSFLILFSSLFSVLFAQVSTPDLTITPSDLLIELRPDGGFHLFIKKKPDISSVLLTETTRDPGMRESNYAYRAGEWNEINGDEIRVLNGIPIPKESKIYSLISSTVVKHPVIGDSFHIYIPYVLYYGYENERHGQVYLVDGTFLNIRAFAMQYADYRGAFRDNPFKLEVNQEAPAEPPTGVYMQETLEAFREIAKDGSGELIYSKGSDDVVDHIKTVLQLERGKTLDLVICFDTTKSMRKYIDATREKLIPMLNEMLGNFPSFRIGMVQFKDYYDNYLTKLVPFTNDFSRFQRDLNAINVQGGGDIPEAVYEALHDAAIKFTWQAESRLIILIGDAPPHPKPRGKITKEIASNAASERNIKVHAMILPHK